MTQAPLRIISELDANAQPQLSHFDPTTAVGGAKRAGSQRCLRRPGTTHGAVASQQVAAARSSFAAPPRPLSLAAFQEALRALDLDSSGSSSNNSGAAGDEAGCDSPASSAESAEERIRALMAQLPAETLRVVEPLRLASRSARDFVAAVLQCARARCQLQYGQELPLHDFRELILHEAAAAAAAAAQVAAAAAAPTPSRGGQRRGRRNNRQPQQQPPQQQHALDASALLVVEARVEALLPQLGPESRALVEGAFRLRRSTEHFLAALPHIARAHALPPNAARRLSTTAPAAASTRLPAARSVAHAGRYLPHALDALLELDARLAGKAPSAFEAVQADVTARMRAVLAEWLVEVAAQFDFSRETAFLALALTDRYLALVRVARHELQLVGVAALMLAAKYEEVYPPDAAEYARMAANAYAPADILRTERAIFTRLQFSVTVATSHAIATCLLALQDPAPTEGQRCAADYLLSVAAVHTHFGQHSQALLAAGAVYASRLWTGIRTGQPSSDVAAAAGLLVSLAQAATRTLASRSSGGGSSSVTGVVVKLFANAVNESVSTWAFPDELLALVPPQRRGD